MKMPRLLLLTASVLVGAWGAAPADAQLRAGVVVDGDGLRTLHLAVGDHYGVPYRTVVRTHRPWLHPDELPVVLFIAREARVGPEAVLALRERGRSWWEISVHLGLGPSVYLAHLPRRVGPPYGKAHGYWRTRAPSTVTRLSDRQIVDFVNLRFHMDHHRKPAREVIRHREGGKAFVQILLGSSRESSSRLRGAGPPARSGPPLRAAPPIRGAPPMSGGPPGRGGPPSRVRRGPPGG